MGLLKRTFSPKEKQVKKNEKSPELRSETPVKKGQKRGFHIEAEQVILRPLVSEKASVLSSLGKYIFVVHLKSTRPQIKTAVRKMYGVTPLNVHFQVYKGKSVRVGRGIGQRKNWKKAIVTLPKGKTINVYEGV
jgi:large subunit ribosomal protein L23